MHRSNGQQIVEKTRLSSVLLGALAVAILAAAPALALARLGSDLLASWQSTPSVAAGVPWSFDAPSSTTERYQVAQRESNGGVPVAGTQDDAILLTDWNYTLKTVASASK